MVRFLRGGTERSPLARAEGARFESALANWKNLQQRKSPDVTAAISTAERLRDLEEENARLRRRLADMTVDSLRWKAVRASPNLFMSIYQRSPQLERHFGKRVSHEPLNHGELSDLAADRLRMVKA